MKKFRVICFKKYLTQTSKETYIMTNYIIKTNDDSDHDDEIVEFGLDV